MYFTIDRFEGKYAVCENNKTRQMINIKKAKLPLEAKEGDIIKLKNGKYYIDNKKTQEVKKQVMDLFESLKENNEKEINQTLNENIKSKSKNKKTSI